MSSLAFPRVFLFVYIELYKLFALDTITFTFPLAIAQLNRLITSTFWGERLAITYKSYDFSLITQEYDPSFSR